MNTEINVLRALKRPSAFIPIVMSLIAVAVVVIRITSHGTAPQTDESTAAHLWQILMVAQVPVIVFFAIKCVPQAPRTAFCVVAVQVAVALAALAPVFLLKW